MGPYCKFCDHRCFVLRRLPETNTTGGEWMMATCPKGMELDRKKCGFDHTTAINPQDVIR